MKNKFALGVLAVLTAAALIGCDKINFFNLGNKEKAQSSSGPESALKGTPIGKVNGMSIDQEDLDLYIEIYNSQVPENQPEKKISARNQKLDILKNDMVRRTLLYQEALRRGLDKNDDIVKALDKGRRALQKDKMDLLILQLAKDETDKVDVSSKEIEDAYNQYKEQFKEPEERQLREIVVSSEQDAKDILIQLLQGADFATLAKDRSKALTAKDGGDTGFIQRGKRSAQFDAVAFSDTLDVGRNSSIFKDKDGYCVLKLEAKRGGKQKSLNEMWEDIKNTLLFLKRQQKLESLFKKLNQEAKTEIYEGEMR